MKAARLIADQVYCLHRVTSGGKVGNCLLLHWVDVCRPGWYEKPTGDPIVATTVQDNADKRVIGRTTVVSNEVFLEI